MGAASVGAFACFELVHHGVWWGHISAIGDPKRSSKFSNAMVTTMAHYGMAGTSWLVVIGMVLGVKGEGRVHYKYHVAGVWHGMEWYMVWNKSCTIP